MKREIEEKVEELVEDLQADGYQKGISWRGYDIYIPNYEEYAVVGLPLVIMVKGEDVRLSTPEEALEYLRICNESQDND